MGEAAGGLQDADSAAEDLKGIQADGAVATVGPREVDLRVPAYFQPAPPSAPHRIDVVDSV